MHEVAYDIEDGAVEHHVTGLDRLQADGLDQVTLPDSRWPQQQHVASLFDEPAGGQVEDRLPLDRRVELPVEVFQRPHLAEAGGLDPPLDHPILADGQFILQDQFQELHVGEAVAGGFLQPHLQRLQQPGEPQLLECRVQ